MTLFDVDKNNDDRGTPMPNSHDQLVRDSVMARGTLSSNYTTGLPNIQGQNTQLGALSLVQTGVVEVITGGTLTVTTKQHNLGFAPYPVASLNNSTVTGISGTVNIPLPTFAGATISGGQVNFTIWLEVIADNTSVYIYTINATGSPVTLFVTYYLYRQPAQQ